MDRADVLTALAGAPTDFTRVETIARWLNVTERTVLVQLHVAEMLGEVRRPVHRRPHERDLWRLRSRGYTRGEVIRVVRDAADAPTVLNMIR